MADDADVYVVFPGGTRIGDEYIAPAMLTGRQSGHKFHVVLTASTKGHRHVWTQWVHIDNILFPDEVEIGPEQEPLA